MFPPSSVFSSLRYLLCRSVTTAWRLDERWVPHQKVAKKQNKTNEPEAKPYFFKCDTNKISHSQMLTRLPVLMVILKINQIIVLIVVISYWCCSVGTFGSHIFCVCSSKTIASQRALQLTASDPVQPLCSPLKRLANTTLGYGPAGPAQNSNFSGQMGPHHLSFFTSPANVLFHLGLQT